MAEYRPKEPEEQVEDLIEKMQTDHDSILTNIKMAAQRDHPNDFIRCVAQIQTELSRYLKKPAPNARGRRISQAKRGNDDQSQGSRGRGRFSRGGGRDGRGGRGAVAVAKVPILPIHPSLSTALTLLTLSVI
jgi:uncharacterized membrane protein YgcG